MFSLSRFLQVKPSDRALLYRFYAVYIISGLLNSMVGVLMPYLGEEYGLSYTLRGVFLSTVQVGNVSAMLLTGILPYVIGRKKDIVLFTSMMVLGYLLILTQGNPVMLFLAFLFTGLGRGTIVNLSNVVVGESAGNKGGGLNMLHACFAIGAFIAPLVFVATVGISWRAAPAIAMLLMASGVVLFATSSLSTEPAVREDGKWELPRTLDYYLVMGMLFCYVAAESGLVGWLVTYFRDSGILPEAFSASMQSLLWVMILIGRLSCAVLSGKMSKNLLLVVTGAGMTLSFLLMVFSSSAPLIALGVLGMGLFMGGIYPTGISTLPSRYASDSTSIGILLGSATVGGIVMPSVIGKIAESAGISGGILSILAISVLMLCFMLVNLVRGK